MSFRLSLAPLSVSIAIILAAAPAWAFCEPSATAQTSCLAGPDKTCKTLGASTLDKDQKNIIACLATDTGNNCAGGHCQWKAMTSSGPIGQCYSVMVRGTGAYEVSGFTPGLNATSVVSVTNSPVILPSYGTVGTLTAICQSGYTIDTCSAAAEIVSASDLALPTAHYNNGCAIVGGVPIPSVETGPESKTYISCCKN